MRHFLVFSRTGRTKGDFRDLRKAGRLDVVVHCLISALFLSGRIRKDVIFHAILTGAPRPPIHLEFVGAKVKDLSSDEKHLATILRKTLNSYERRKRVEAFPGIFIEKNSLQGVIKKLHEKEVDIFVLREDGINLRKLKLSNRHNCFVVGDFIGLPKKDEEFILRYAKNVISIGPFPYFASHCITVINNELDNREYIF